MGILLTKLILAQNECVNQSDVIMWKLCITHASWATFVCVNNNHKNHIVTMRPQPGTLQPDSIFKYGSFVETTTHLI